MFIQICLAIITTAAVILTALLVRLCLQTQKTIRQIQLDLDRVSAETSRLSKSISEFVSSDLHQLSEKSCGFIDELTQCIGEKPPILRLLSDSLRLLSPKKDAHGSSYKNFSSQCEAIPQILKWIVTSVSLIKKTREYVKRV